MDSNESGTLEISTLRKSLQLCNHYRIVSLVASTYVFSAKNKASTSSVL